ncbi:helix-hairpin-helix domain-containing protein [Alkaliphilus peptidifermentans]|uniref:helix-hairpin-helix domain-containing protein n=1 Tax=Alkaliphilus peptidifermentans TaxID=426129 RepID=UPI000B89AE96|nr:helix-hairpin-helix domain-containing protein [Alkaliphilus peptidifermentans]
MRNNSKQKQLIIIIVSIVLLMITYLNYSKNKQNRYVVSPQNQIKESNENIIEKKPDNQINILVHVEGAVNSPGVYEFTGEARIIDAIKAAGGVTDAADTSKVNMAMKIKDEDFIYIPEKGEEFQSSHQNLDLHQSNTPQKVNINSASINELATLSGIGDALAQRIIEHRNENGPFTSIEDIKKVSGIGEKKYEAIKEYIMVR